MAKWQSASKNQYGKWQWYDVTPEIAAWMSTMDIKIRLV